jgi:hypothetical protein
MMLQTPKCMFPVIVAATPVPKEEERDLLQVSINRTKDERTHFVIFQYTSLLLQVRATLLVLMVC